jgi:hypothetical protein
MKLGGDGTGAGSRRAVARGDGHPPARASQATLGVIRICPGDSSPADRAPGCTSRTCLGLGPRARLLLGQIADRAGNDSGESAGAFCCLSATTLATNVETNARASLSHWAGHPRGTLPRHTRTFTAFPVTATPIGPARRAAATTVSTAEHHPDHAPEFRVGRRQRSR